ncbi:MAG: YggT family protein [Actinomycetota bacterium]
MGASPISALLCLALEAYSFVLLVWVVLSWATAFGFRPPIDGPLRALIDLIEALVRPVLRPLRSMMPPLRAGGVGIDLSVIVAFVIIQVAQRIVC